MFFLMFSILVRISWGQIYLYEEENSPSLFIVQRLSMNLDVPPAYPLDINC